MTSDRQTAEVQQLRSVQIAGASVTLLSVFLSELAASLFPYPLAFGAFFLAFLSLGWMMLCYPEICTGYAFDDDSADESPRLWQIVVIWTRLIRVLARKAIQRANPF